MKEGFQYEDNKYCFDRSRLWRTFTCKWLLKVSKVPVKIKTVVDAYDLEKARRLANIYGIENVSMNIEEVLNDPK